jgi:hypothetical protein
VKGTPENPLTDDKRAQVSSAADKRAAAMMTPGQLAACRAEGCNPADYLRALTAGHGVAVIRPTKRYT